MDSNAREPDARERAPQGVTKLQHRLSKSAIGDPEIAYVAVGSGIHGVDIGTTNHIIIIVVIVIGISHLRSDEARVYGGSQEATDQKHFLGEAD